MMKFFFWYLAFLITQKLTILSAGALQIRFRDFVKFLWPFQNIWTLKHLTLYLNTPTISEKQPGCPNVLLHTFWLLIKWNAFFLFFLRFNIFQKKEIDFFMAFNFYRIIFNLNGFLQLPFTYQLEFHYFSKLIF